MLVNTQESTGLKHFIDPKAIINYSNDMGDIYENIEEYNPAKKQKILIVFDNMTADMLGNIKLNPIATELFIRCRRLNISLVFITQTYFAVRKYYAKFHKLFLHENSKQMKFSTNCF